MCKSEYDRIQAFAIAYADIDDWKRQMKMRITETADSSVRKNGLEEQRVEQRQEADGERGQLVANIRRLTGIVLDKLEQGSKEGTLDQAQIRLLGSIVMRSLGLWEETLNPRPRRSPRREIQSTEERLATED